MNLIIKNSPTILMEMGKMELGDGANPTQESLVGMGKAELGGKVTPTSAELGDKATPTSECTTTMDFLLKWMHKSH